MPEAPQLRDIIHHLLHDGTRLTARRVRPEDKQRLRDGIRMFSPTTLYRRFFAPIADLSAAQLRFLTEVDQVDHVAWGALDDDHPEVPGLGVGRWVRLAEEPRVAECAIIVLDAYQGRGIGTVLLAILNECAAAGGVEVLRSLVLAENTGFVATLRGYGGKVRHAADGVLTVDLPVLRDALPPGDDPRAQRYARTLVSVRAALRG